MPVQTLRAMHAGSRPADGAVSLPKGRTLTAGLGGADRHGCVALADGRRVVGICEQERVSRVRAAGFGVTGLPDGALDLLLTRAGATRADIARFVIAEDAARVAGFDAVRLNHHQAHACTAYLTSPLTSAAIVVCDHEAPKVSVWRGAGAEISPVDWAWTGPGFADLYSACARLAGFGADAGDQRFEALARLAPPSPDPAVDAIVATDGHRLLLAPDWESTVGTLFEAARRREGMAQMARIAAALQARLGELFLQVLAEVRRRTGAEAVCLGGSFFYHSSMNTLARGANLFPTVFVPIDPGNPGLAAGAALHATGSQPRRLSPFLGPEFDPIEIKATLDNCKLRYNWVEEDEAIGLAVGALRQGRLVGWFQGAMEWGPRALGGRSILADPFAPFVLENLNTFLKRRESWRGYALSALQPSVASHFSGPGEAPFMECDYRPRDRATFAQVLPAPDAAIRVQTVGPDAAPRYRQLLEAFGKAAGVPCLVNTSFNGFHEPIVCTPRDAVRVFYGSGLDVLVMDRFVLTK